MGDLSLKRLNVEDLVAQLGAIERELKEIEEEVLKIAPGARRSSLLAKVEDVRTRARKLYPKDSTVLVRGN